MVIDLSACPTQQGFGDVVGVRQQAVSDMVGRGVLPAGASTEEWIKAYREHLREVAAGRLSDGGGLDLVEERAALAREQKIRLQMQNAVTKKQLAPVVVIEEVLAKARNIAAAVSLSDFRDEEPGEESDGATPAADDESSPTHV